MTSLQTWQLLSLTGWKHEKEFRLLPKCNWRISHTLGALDSGIAVDYKPNLHLTLGLLFPAKRNGESEQSSKFLSLSKQVDFKILSLQNNNIWGIEWAFLAYTAHMSNMRKLRSLRGATVEQVLF